MTAAVLAAALLPAAAPAGAAEPLRRGIEAERSALPGRVLARPGTSSGAVVRVRLDRGPVAWPIPLAAGPRLALRAGGCTGRIGVRVDGGPRRTARTRRAQRRIVLALPVRAGRRVVVLERRGDSCATVDVDRLDLDLDAVRITLGAALRPEQLDRPGVADAFRREYRFAMTENALKMRTTQPFPGLFLFDAADRLRGLARSVGGGLHGHTLLMHDQLPAWLDDRIQGWTRPLLLEALRQHVAALVGRYRGTARTWDVVTEAIRPDGSDWPSIWRRAIGPDVVEHAFRFAREADPGARLLYSDNAIENPGAHRDGVLRMLRRLVRAGAPIDGVALQGHLKPEIELTPAQLDDTMTRIEALGLRVQFSEVDVPLGLPVTAAWRLYGARAFGMVADACWQHASCDALGVWGVTDATSWWGPEREALPLDAAGRPKDAMRRLRLGVRGRLVAEDPVPPSAGAPLGSVVPAAGRF
ncbi:endo-1,4-beta-xylanase [Patulibacter brassicae]|uniref:Beta-xylanase n=1 Tax=Patulibacter brassicae TaxID=1705717 RepID=A0ABU4VHX9_9ACTN|nr:endo-1,4-beta-xylanase [Patulibacter brassicae]MDX8150541.1 endo-1,4-beta-xylanase [Patulibacter brassicae]